MAHQTPKHQYCTQGHMFIYLCIDRQQTLYDVMAHNWALSGFCLSDVDPHPTSCVRHILCRGVDKCRIQKESNSSLTSISFWLCHFRGRTSRPKDDLPFSFAASSVSSSSEEMQSIVRTFSTSSLLRRGQLIFCRASILRANFCNKCYQLHQLMK